MSILASLASLSSSPSPRVLEINGANMDHVRSVQDATALLNQAMHSIFISIIVVFIVNSFTETGSRRSFHHPAEEHHLLWASQLIIKVSHISPEDGCNWYSIFIHHVESANRCGQLRFGDKGKCRERGKVCLAKRAELVLPFWPTSPCQF